MSASAPASSAASPTSTALIFVSDQPDRIFTDSGTSTAARTAATSAASLRGFFSSADPLPRRTMRSMGQPKLRSMKCAP